MKANPTSRWVVIVLILLTISRQLMAQDRNGSTPGPFDFTPIVSYGGGMNLAMQPVVPGKNPRLVVNASPSYGFAFGVKLLVSRRVAFRFQALWLSTLIDPHGNAVCGSGCQLHFAGTLGSQAELTLGPVFRF